MGRLFDSGKSERDAAEVRRDRDEIRQRAEAVDNMLQENLELDEATKKLGEHLAGAETVQAIRYEAYRPKGSKWNIEHAQVGDDYVYQMFPLRVPKIHWKDVIGGFIAALDAIFPRTVQIKYVPPSERFQLKYYTIRVEKVASLPGWEDAARERALRSLSAVDAWPLPAPAGPESA